MAEAVAAAGVVVAVVGKIMIARTTTGSGTTITRTIIITKTNRHLIRRTKRNHGNSDRSSKVLIMTVLICLMLRISSCTYHHVDQWESLPLNLA